MNPHPLNSPPAGMPRPAATWQSLPGIQPGRPFSRASAPARSLFVEELEQLARLAAFRPDLRMVVGQPGSDWCFDWRTGTITIDGGRLETESADFTRGLVLHESAHAAITRLEAIVPAEVLKDQRLFALLNVVEDCRIETWMPRRFPGCRPWVREYNDRLFRPVLAADRERPPAAQFLNGILTRWWFGKVAEPLSDDVRQALDSVWPALEQVLQALPPAPDTLGDPSAAYARNPVARCYTATDDLVPPDPWEQAIRMAQFEMWSVVHQSILPAYLRLLPPEDNLGKDLMEYFFQLQAAAPDGHLRGQLTAASGVPANLRIRGRASHNRIEPPLAPTGQDPYLQSWRRQHAAIELLAEILLRWFQAHGRIRLRHGCPWGSRLNLRAAMRFEADPRLYDQLWSRPLVPTRIDPHFSLVIDRSGSMQGEKMEQSFHGVVLLCEVCRRVGVPLNVYSFGSRAERLLHHDEPLSAEVRARLGSLPHSAAGGTNLTAALQLVAQDVGSSLFQDRLVFVLSDGEPDDDESVRQQIAWFAGEGVSMVGLGLGPETRRLQEFFPVSRTNLTASELPAALATLLVQALQSA